MKLGRIVKGYELEGYNGNRIYPKRCRKIECDNGEKGLAISFKMRGSWIVWKIFN